MRPVLPDRCFTNFLSAGRRYTVIGAHLALLSVLCASPELQSLPVQGQPEGVREIIFVSEPLTNLAFARVFASATPQTVNRTGYALLGDEYLRAQRHLDSAYWRRNFLWYGSGRYDEDWSVRLERGMMPDFPGAPATIPGDQVFVGRTFGPGSSGQPIATLARIVLIRSDKVTTYICDGETIFEVRMPGAIALSDDRSHVEIKLRISRALDILLNSDTFLLVALHALVAQLPEVQQFCELTSQELAPFSTVRRAELRTVPHSSTLDGLQPTQMYRMIEKLPAGRIAKLLGLVLQAYPNEALLRSPGIRSVLYFTPEQRQKSNAIGERIASRIDEATLKCQRFEFSAEWLGEERDKILAEAYSEHLALMSEQQRTMWEDLRGIPMLQLLPDAAELETPRRRLSLPTVIWDGGDYLQGRS